MPVKVLYFISNYADFLLNYAEFPNRNNKKPDLIPEQANNWRMNLRTYGRWQ